MRGIVAPHNPGWSSEARSTRSRSWHDVHGIHEAWRHVVTDSQSREGESQGSQSPAAQNIQLPREGVHRDGIPT